MKLTPSSTENQTAGHEARILMQLAGPTSLDLKIPASIPQLVAQGYLPQPHIHLHHYMVLKPFGRRPIDGPLQFVFWSVLVHVCDALGYAYRKSNLLHRDVSYGNIVVVGCPLSPQGVLIDWHVADNKRNYSRAADIVGTRRYTAHRLFRPGHLRSLLDHYSTWRLTLLQTSICRGSSRHARTWIW